MANLWLRLWHEMPNDPKWRTISRISGETVSTVLAVYIHLMVDASQNTKDRGKSTLRVEDLESALDLSGDSVRAILSAMETRVIDDGVLSGWDRRQPAREIPLDSSAKTDAERKREQRARQKQNNSPKKDSKPVAKAAKAQDARVTNDTSHPVPVTEDAVEVAAVNKEIGNHSLPGFEAPAEVKVKRAAKNKAESVVVSCEDAFPEVEDRGLVSDWYAIRIHKRAVVTESAMNGIRNEAEKAGVTVKQALQICCVNGWSGYRSSWAGSSDGKITTGNSRHVLEGKNYASGIASDGRLTIKI